MKKTFKDIKKGDLVRWTTGGMLTGTPETIITGKAEKFICGSDGLVDVWMCRQNGYFVTQPVTPSSFKGFRKIVR